ncbi:fumarylacetoacetate hydrolase family protein [Ensifer soli]|uniref:fumarylacetoacetate hydrolase family protein n=1 Tax=Ciceribacter sp. sgz301302 TaxID=3342379 RepID=UPI0035B90FAA
MPDTVFSPPEPVLLPVLGTASLFPVRRVYCVGRNYEAHAREMGHSGEREPPFFFQKNPDNLVNNGGRFPYPALSSSVHHEVELVVALKAGGAEIDADGAIAAIFGYGVGIDFTRRDLQAEAKAAGKPWTAAKAFEFSAPVSPITPVASGKHPFENRIWLSVNGDMRQDATTAEMIWRVPEIICELSRLFTLAPGDVILTGTPAGVGAVHRGDRVDCGVDGVATLSVDVI